MSKHTFNYGPLGLVHLAEGGACIYRLVYHAF